MPTTLEADYLIIGAGATAMAFADTLLTETDATIAMLDRRHCPGGHWNDAYPFVRPHSPSSFYGVNSAPLGLDRIETNGTNRGHMELASGAEIVGYFDQVMRQRFLPSGRVTFLATHDYHNGAATSRLSGKSVDLQARLFSAACRSRSHECEQSS
jgi:cation diffusion facilitator CzcD-associated flavoprotein CzcO